MTVFTSAQFALGDAPSHPRQRAPDHRADRGAGVHGRIAITSLTIYTATIEKTREFGMMKAVGFNNRDLYQLVLIQSCVTAALGFVFGVVLTLIVSRFIDRVVAQFILYIRPIDIFVRTDRDDHHGGGRGDRTGAARRLNRSGRRVQGVTMSRCVLELVEVSQQFGDKANPTHALRSVSLQVPERQVMIVMGPSGAGKSTLLGDRRGPAPPDVRAR